MARKKEKKAKISAPTTRDRKYLAVFASKDIHRPLTSWDDSAGVPLLWVGKSETKSKGINGRFCGTTEKTRLGLECDHKQTENAQQAPSFLFHWPDVSPWSLCPQIYLFRHSSLFPSIPIFSSPHPADLSISATATPPSGKAAAQPPVCLGHLGLSRRSIMPNLRW